jgi:hypothetical protein
MMSRRPFLLVLLLALLGVIGPASAQEGTDGDPLDGLAACARDTGRLSVLLLMDESGSLPRTDPEAQRVAAAQTAVRSLARLGASPQVAVDLAVAGFSVDYGLVSPWSELDGDSVGDLVRGLETFRDRDDGLDTDFAAALLGAEDEFSRRAAETGGAGCELLLLFTDGDYDVEERNTAARRQTGVEKVYAPGIRLDEPDNAARVVELGRELMCESDGIVDRLRGEGVAIVTIALEQEISNDDRAFLQAVSTGGAQATSCGETEGTGVYVSAGGLTELLRGFNRAANQIAGGTAGLDEASLPICDRERCVEGSREFDLDPAYEQFHLLANTGAPDVLVEVLGPGGAGSVQLSSGENGTVAVGSVDLEIVWLSPIDVAIDGVLPASGDDWQGTWTLTFIDPTGRHADAVASAQLYLFGGLSPELVVEPQIRMGETATFEVQVVDAAGTPRTPADFVRSADVSVSVTDPVTGRIEELPVDGPDVAGASTASWSVPDDLQAASVNVSTRLDVVAATGVALQPRVHTTVIPVQPPATFPSLGPASLELSSISGASGTATGILTISGGAESGGCVWFEGVNVGRAPRNSEDVVGTTSPEASTEAACLAVGAGEQRDVELLVVVDRVASGSVEGAVVARLGSDASADLLTSELPFTFEMHRPVDQARRIGLTALLLTIGFAIPFLVLWLLNWWGARFQPLAHLRTAAVPVRVDAAGRVLRTDGTERPLRFEPADFRNAPGSDEPVRDARVEDVHFRPRVPLWPFLPAHGVATAEGAHLTAAGGSFSRKRTIRGKVPFSLARQWIFTLADADIPEDGAPDVRGTLRIFLPLGPMQRQIGPTLDEIGRSLPTAAHDLARRAPAVPVEDSSDEPAPVPSGGADGGGGWNPDRSGGARREAPTTTPGSGDWQPDRASPTRAGATYVDGSGSDRPEASGGGPPPLTEPTNHDDPTPGWQPPSR